jgi:hypothetical protein
MGRYYCIILSILLALIISGCQNSQTTQLEATNTVLNNQVNTLITQLTQQASSSQLTQQALSQVNKTPEQPLVSPSPISTEVPLLMPPVLIFSGLGSSSFTSNTYYPEQSCGAANVHYYSSPSGNGGGFMIDNSLGLGDFHLCPSAGCDVWYILDAPITLGKHYVTTTNENDRYEIWSIGTPPFTLSIKPKTNTYNYLFQINESQNYKISTNLTRGAFGLQIFKCESVGPIQENININITESSTKNILLNPGYWNLLIRDSTPGGGGEVELKLAPAQ